MSPLSWEQVREEGKEAEKWILVNVQDAAIFDCQILNRDIWKNPGIMETVKEQFLFMQFVKDDPRGNQYVQYYFPNRESPDAYPHIAIVDPRTGEQVKVWSGPPAPKAMDFLMQLHEFLDRYSLKAAAKNPVARRKPEVRKETQVEKMTEEQMLERALQNSLVGTEASRDFDPDDLTRSIGNLDDLTRPSQVEGSIEGVESAPVSGSSLASPPSSFSLVSSSKPHTEPPPNSATSTRIQFRHPTGRVVRRFLLTDPVQRIYEWLKSSPLDGKDGVEFELIFMQRNLMEALGDSIEQAGLQNGTVMVEFLQNEG
jgi:UBX domain-containing protein 7